MNEIDSYSNSIDSFSFDSSAGPSKMVLELSNIKDKNIGTGRENVFKYCFIADKLIFDRVEFEFIDNEAFALSFSNKYQDLTEGQITQRLVKNIAAVAFDSFDIDGDGMTSDADIEPLIYNNRWALLAANIQKESEEEFKYSIQQHYELMINNGWKADNIRALAQEDIVKKYNYVDTDWTVDSDGNGDYKDDDDAEWIDAKPNFNEIEAGMHWLVANAEAHDIVLIVLIDHGLPAFVVAGETGFGTDSPTTLERYFPSDLNVHLMDLNKDAYLIGEFDMCWSGGWVEDCSGHNRLMVSSQNEDLPSYTIAYRLYEILSGALRKDSTKWWHLKTADEIGDNNGEISVEEAHRLATFYCRAHYQGNDYYIWKPWNGDPNIIQEPQINDQIPGEIYI
ncbi:MAG: hypothetical protein ACXQTE_00665 [Methanosarcinaceae archaeon]